MSRTKVDKELLAAITVKIAPRYSKITSNLYQSRTLAILHATLLPERLSKELSVAEEKNSC
jgi:hypothetical protein